MNKKIGFILSFVLFFGLSSFNAHKFYVSIYQVDFAPANKRVEITARIFMDDLNLALEDAYKVKTRVGESTETKQDLAFLQKYLNKHLRVFVDGKEKEVLYLSKEMENNVVIIYLKIIDIKKFKSIKIQNSALLELYPEQQNIIQTNFYNEKRNFIFKDDYFVQNINIK